MRKLDKQIEKEVEAIMKKAMQLSAGVQAMTKRNPNHPDAIAMRRSTASLVTNLGMALEIAKRETPKNSD
jgi:hypothetical protein